MEFMWVVRKALKTRWYIKTTQFIHFQHKEFPSFNCLHLVMKQIIKNIIEEPPIHKEICLLQSTTTISFLNYSSKGKKWWKLKTLKAIQRRIRDLQASPKSNRISLVVFKSIVTLSLLLASILRKYQTHSLIISSLLLPLAAGHISWLSFRSVA